MENDSQNNNPENQKSAKKLKPLKKKKGSPKWLIWGLSVLLMSFILTTVFSLLTEIAIKGSPAYICVIVLLVLLVLNIGCDILANAIVSCKPDDYHAMASKKIKGAKRAVKFCKNAEKLSSIFADVIGDICGIVSGAAGTALVAYFAVYGNLASLIASIVISAIIGALTVGGKALCKPFAIKYNKKIVFAFAKFTTLFKKEK